MDLYAVYSVNDGYEGYNALEQLFFQEANARKALETLQKDWIAGRFDSRFKQWWAEEPLQAEFPNTIACYRLYDSSITRYKDHHSSNLLEIRVLQTGDEPKNAKTPH